MILRSVVWSIFMCLVLRPIVKAEVKVEDQGYQNVLISFAPNVPSENGKEFIHAIQDLVQNTSNVLHTAVGIRIASVTFVLPLSWPVETWKDITITPASSEQMERKPDINVDATEMSPFVITPVTLQHGGCGVGGHQIILPLNFISSTDGYSKDKLLAREWLKYRYGVFEENGFPNDNLYPDYYRVPGSSEIRITECTNSNVTYNFKKPISGEECDMDSSSDFGHCRAYPDEESAVNVTSSLMYHHNDLANMEHICGKDGHPHHSTARNKQNALCNGQSIWDVIKVSNDFENTQRELTDPVQETIQFSYIQESKPRFVVLLEDSEQLINKRQPILFALRRFYYDLPPKNRLAIFTYNNEVEKVLGYTELTDQTRSDLGTITNFDYPGKDICNSCGLTKAIEVLLQNSEVEAGSVLLITASPLDIPLTIQKEVKNAGICLHVLRFLEDGTEDASYDTQLKDSFPCYSYEPLVISLDDLEISNSLSRFLRKPVPVLKSNFEVKTTVSGKMSANSPVTISPDSTASVFTLWTGRDLKDKRISCKAGENSVTLTKVMGGNDISSFNITPTDVDITCRLDSTATLPVLTEVQVTTQKGSYFIFDIWIHDASTDKKQLPIIVYAKIYFGGYPVQDANVGMVVTSENNPDVNVKMLDNGRGDPDVTEFDGIYSGYFTDFITEGDYRITVKIDDNEGKAKIGKLNPTLNSDTCCGSKVISNNADAPTFNMEKHTVYTAKNKRPDDGYPPSRILDLEVHIFNTSDFVLLTWTAPVGGKAGRYELKLFQKRENAISHFETTGNELNTSSIVPGDTGKVEGLVIPVPDLEEDTTYYVTLRSWSEFNKTSKISNVAEFFIPKPDYKTSVGDISSTPEGITDDDGKKRAQIRKRTIEIVVGVLAGIVVLCILVYLAVYFFVQKPKKARAKKKTGEHGAALRNSGTPSGPTGLNSIPADVIIKHHNEVLEAKSLHKDPPIFNEVKLDSFKSSPELPENSRLNNKVAQYTMVQKASENTAPNSSQQDPSKSPKRMTVV